MIRAAWLEAELARRDAELAELTETEKQWKQKLEYATMNPSTTAQELHQLEDQLKRIGFAKEELEERVAANHAHDEDPPEDEAGEEVRIDPLTLQASERCRLVVLGHVKPRLSVNVFISLIAWLLAHAA